MGCISHTHTHTHTHRKQLFLDLFPQPLTTLQECARTPGFISMMRSSAGGTEKMQYLDYENYRHITFKWHFKLTKALVVLLESKDYMQVCMLWSCDSRTYRRDGYCVYGSNHF